MCKVAVSEVKQWLRSELYFELYFAQIFPSLDPEFVQQKCLLGDQYSNFQAQSLLSSSYNL